MPEGPRVDHEVARVIVYTFLIPLSVLTTAPAHSSPSLFNATSFLPSRSLPALVDSDARSEGKAEKRKFL
jgi:hypothetical protein